MIKLSKSKTRRIGIQVMTRVVCKTIYIEVRSHLSVVGSDSFRQEDSVLQVSQGEEHNCMALARSATTSRRISVLKYQYSRITET